MNPIKIAIAEDHSILRKTLVESLGMLKNMEIVIEVGNGQDLLDQLEKTKADIVILDNEMPILNGYHTLIEIRKKYPDLKVIMYTALSEKPVIERFLELGANDFICKLDDFKNLLNSINNLSK